MRDDNAHLGVSLLGLPGFRVMAAWEFADERIVAVETTATEAWCRGCGARAGSKGRATVQIRDLPSSGKSTRLAWRKRIWRCDEPGCPVGVVAGAPSGDRAARGADRAGPGGGRPPGRG